MNVSQQAGGMMDTGQPLPSQWQRQSSTDVHSLSSQISTHCHHSHCHHSHCHHSHQQISVLIVITQIMSNNHPFSTVCPLSTDVHSFIQSVHHQRRNLYRVQHTQYWVHDWQQVRWTLPRMLSSSAGTSFSKLPIFKYFYILQFVFESAVYSVVTRYVSNSFLCIHYTSAYFESIEHDWHWVTSPCP